MGTLQLVTALAHFLAFIIYLGLIGFVLYKNPKAQLNRLCALTLASFAIWCLGNTFFHAAPSAEEAMFWMNICSLGWCTFPILALWFYLAFTRHEKLLNNRLFIAICVMLALSFVYLQWASYLITDLSRQPYGWAIIWSTSGPPFFFYVYYFLFITACPCLTFDFARKTEDLREKKQARLLSIAAIIALVLGSLTDILFPVLEFTIIPSIACIIILIWGASLVYAITRYGLMSFTPAAAANDILATMGDSLLLTDMSGKILSANQATSELLGYTGEELVTKELRSIVDSKTIDGDSLLQETLERGKISSRNAAYLTRDGRVIPVLLSASVVKDREGESVGVVVTAHDMTEHQKMEHDLRQSEERYRTLVDLALVGIGVHQNGRYVFVNKEYAAMLGYTQAELIGLSTAETIHSDERDFILARSRRRLAGYNEPITYEARLLKKDGSTLYTLVSNAVIEYNGQPATLITVADITDSKTRAELEQANKELEAFNYSVSHDLRAPLRSIDGFSQALLEDYEDKLDAQGRDYLHRVRTAAQHMEQLIDDLLNLSRLSRADTHLRPLDLSAMAKAIAAELREKKPGRAVEFIIADGVAAYGDPSLLHIALENLLGNAWKFTGKHPHATIEFGVSQQDGQPVYFVRDDGAGFDMAYVDKLFTPFQRLHTSTEFEGTGIGLAIVQRIIRRHGGTIWAEGEVGKGATFYFTLQSHEDRGM